tara:strand:+ start:213 stop:458 length:246 start_codon:yes stop_codon:yes gene_type:complete
VVTTAILVIVVVIIIIAVVCIDILATVLTALKVVTIRAGFTHRFSRTSAVRCIVVCERFSAAITTHHIVVTVRAYNLILMG